MIKVLIDWFQSQTRTEKIGLGLLCPMVIFLCVQVIKALFTFNIVFIVCAALAAYGVYLLTKDE